MQIPPEPTGAPSDAPPRSGTRLDSWKEIAAYLNRDIRTVQRWEKTASLPILRLNKPGLRAVFAYTSDLDQWLKLQNPEPATASTPIPAPPNTSRLRWLALAVASTVVILLGFTWVYRPKPSIPLPPRPITSEQGVERDPDLSPDGKYITYAAPTPNSPFNIFVRQLDGSQPVQLTDNPLENRSPSWSPDGSRIAFLRGAPTQTVSLMILPALGGDESKLTDFAPHASRRFLNIGRLLTWTPDGKHLIFPDRGTTLTSPLYLFDLNTRERKQITFPANTELDMEPSLSPDGRTLLFTRAHTEQVSTIMVQPLTPALLPDGPPRKISGVGPWNASPVWLPSTGDILFCSGPWPRLHLYRTSSTEAIPPQPYAATGDHAMQLALHAPSNRLIYRNNRIQNDILRYSIDKPGPAQPIVQSTFVDRSPAFSPNGNQIAFVSDRNGTRQIWVSDSDGKNPTPWTSGLESDIGRPDWSPDGRKLLFVANTSGKSQLFSVDADTRKVTRLTSDKLDYMQARFSRDGKTIFASAKDAAVPAIYSIPASGGQPTLRLKTPAYIVAESPDTRSLYAFMTHPDRSRSLSRFPLDGSQPERLTNVANPETIAPTRDGFMHLSVQDRQVSLFFLPFAGKERRIQTFDMDTPRSLVISPDAKSFLITRAFPPVSDLNLVENVR